MVNNWRITPLGAFSHYLREQYGRLFEQWLTAIAAEAALVDADRLTREQLSDHLPDIFEGICVAVEACDLEGVEATVAGDARRHGGVRWSQGYRIEELSRELDLFRQVLLGAVEDFAALNRAFTRMHEKRARQLVDEAISLITMNSIREAIGERDRRINEYTHALERANQELTLRQQLVDALHESRMQMTRSVAHDMRNFLNALSIALQLVDRAPANLDAGLALATRQVVDMTQLVDDMVEYSVVLADRASLAVEEIDLAVLCDELATTCRPPIEAKGLALSVVFDETLRTVLSSRLKLKQIGLNLLTNATKYTEGGGIELAMGPLGTTGWYLRVTDTGVGIAAADRERVFKEFERAARHDTPGVGLGLAIVRELCRVLRGDIRFASREGYGTRFEIRFPVDPRQGG